jgi:5-methylcytosine-specific restriction endonuclease McrA
MMKVVRRDGQICQKCNKHVPDPEVEFDHIIPFSKGGRSTVENLRVVHRECNRQKSNSLREILPQQPIQHLWELQNSDR